jgi:hypothetical protein
MQDAVNRTSQATEKALAAAHKLGEARRASEESPERASFQEHAQGLLADIAVADAGITGLVTLLNTAHFLRSWMLVMLVAFTEAYLHDAFSLLIAAGLRGGSLAQAAAVEITEKWIKNVIRGGNPHEWIKHLTNFGAMGYAPDLANQMKSIWDRRHLITHTAEPEIDATSAQQFIDAAKLLHAFVETTDRFVVASYIHTKVVTSVGVPVG